MLNIRKSWVKFLENARHTNSFNKFLMPTHMAIDVSCFDWLNIKYFYQGDKRSPIII